MSKEKFNWKALFVNDESSTSNSEEKETANKTSFPITPTKSPTSFNSKTVVSGKTDEGVLNKIVEMYEQGFDSLNKPGYDFYEFFKAIKAVGSNDSNVYKMAFTMAQGVDSSISKDKLLTQGQFYINEIDKVHQQYGSQGNLKKQQIETQEKNKKEGLTNEIASLEKQLLEIQTKISAKKNELDSTDSNLMAKVSKIDQKIVANNLAKSKISEEIELVINGIKNNI